jgi:hypothetical protein
MSSEVWNQQSGLVESTKFLSSSRCSTSSAGWVIQVFAVKPVRCGIRIKEINKNRKTVYSTQQGSKRTKIIHFHWEVAVITLTKPIKVHQKKP